MQPPDDDSPTPRRRPAGERDPWETRPLSKPARARKAPGGATTASGGKAQAGEKARPGPQRAPAGKRAGGAAEAPPEAQAAKGVAKAAPGAKAAKGVAKAAPGAKAAKGVAKAAPGAKAAKGVAKAAPGAKAAKGASKAAPGTRTRARQRDNGDAPVRTTAKQSTAGGARTRRSTERPLVSAPASRQVTVLAPKPFRAPYTSAPKGTVAPPSQPRPDGDRSQDARLSRTVRRLKQTIAVLLVLGICGFLLDGANRPANPKLVPAYDPTAAKGSPAMGTATLSVSTHAAAPACVLEAVTPKQQSFGLMDRTSVAPYAGMAFVFTSPSVERFWMKETVIPLSIAWFDAGGRFLSETLMPPCPKLVRNCPTYGPSEPYSLAVEVPAGRLGSLGIGPGSTVQLGGPCS